jgi:hypothetical protein
MASLKHSTGFEVGFPTGRDSATFWVKGTEIPSLSLDKGTTGQAQNLAEERGGPGQLVKTWDGTWDMGRDRVLIFCHGTGF